MITTTCKYCFKGLDIEAKTNYVEDYCNEYCRLEFLARQLLKEKGYKPQNWHTNDTPIPIVKTRSPCKQCGKSIEDIPSNAGRLFCTLACMRTHDNLKADTSPTVKVIKKTKKPKKEKKECYVCKCSFTPFIKSQKLCSEICHSKIAIVKSNEKWAARDLEAIRKKIAKRNVRNSSKLNQAHVQDKIWNDKNYRSVRG